MKFWFIVEQSDRLSLPRLTRNNLRIKNLFGVRKHFIEVKRWFSMWENSKAASPRVVSVNRFTSYYLSRSLDETMKLGR